MALAQISGTPSSVRARTVSTLASMSVPMRDDRPARIVHAELAQRLLVGGVGLHHVGEPVGQLWHDLRVVVDAEHLVAEPDQRVGDLAAEPAQADHDDAVVLGVLSC